MLHRNEKMTYLIKKIILINAKSKIAQFVHTPNYLMEPAKNLGYLVCAIFISFNHLFHPSGKNKF